MSDLIDRQKAIDALIALHEAHKADQFTGDLLHWTGIKAMLENIPSAEPEHKWIPVTEALPKNYERTICIDSRGAMMIGMYGEYGWTFPCYMTEPVAWMPLPERYRGDR